MPTPYTDAELDVVRDNTLSTPQVAGILGRTVKGIEWKRMRLGVRRYRAADSGQCRHGHPWVSDNVYRSPKGGQECRQCRGLGRALTHCKRAGHEFTPENTRVVKCRDGWTRRFCRACDRERLEAAFSKRREFRAALTELPEWRDDECWLPVVGFEGAYSVSDHGRVRSESRIIIGRKGQHIRYQGRLLAQCLRKKDGRLEVGLRSPRMDRADPPTKRLVHRLVLEAFIGPKPRGMVCCHWDDDPLNNRLSNLRWDTMAENERDKARNAARRLPIEELRAMLALREAQLTWR